MSRYRLELWFDFENASTELQWGIAKANVTSDVTFSQGGTPMPAANGIVSITDGQSSTFDIYVIDVTDDSVARNLDFIQIDYEAEPGYTGKDPMADAPSLRSGMTGADFNGPVTGAAGYTTTPSEVTVMSVTPNLVGQRRWSLKDGFLGLTDGHYSFTGTIKVSLASDSTQVKTYSFDPEMDIEN